MLKSLLLAAAVAALVSPAFANAATYRGTVGEFPIVVEFANAPETAQGIPFGRYFHEPKGVDIPLFSLGADGNLFFLEEKAPCTPEACATDENGALVVAPPSGAWQLEILNDGNRLTGFWSGPDSTETLPVALELIGSRPFDAALDGTPEHLAQFAADALWFGHAITEDTSPYDFLKMEKVDLEIAEKVVIDGNTVWYMVDPRTRFRYPRLAYLTDGSDADPAFSFLEQRHWAMNASALSCMAMQYPGMGWNGFIAESVGTLGGHEDETVTVTYVSPTVMSWTESGSLWCGGAHPYNHSETHNLDVRAGERLDLSRIFAVWIAEDFEGNAVDLEAARANPADHTWGPSEELIEFVLATRTPDDPEFEAECGIEELIREYLTISFKQGERVVFGLGGLPHVIQACADDVLEIPLADLPAEFLKPDAVDYFPSLAS